MAMHPRIVITLTSLLTANAFLLPDCLWDSDSWEIPEVDSQPRRYRRFLWDDSDVCDWMCDPDLLPHEICNTCCRRSVKPRPADQPSKPRPNELFYQNSSEQPAASTQPSNAGHNVLPPIFSQPSSQSQIPVGQNWQPLQPNQNWSQQPQPQNQNWQQQPQPQNQNWQQQPQPQNQNWQQEPQPQNQNWQQEPQPQNQNWQQQPQPQNQNWQQQPQPQNQNWQQQPQPQNQNWQQQPQPQNQNWNPQLQAQIASGQVPLNNELLHVQVPINLTGLFQAQVPSRLTNLLQGQPEIPTQGQAQGVPPIVRPSQPRLPLNGGSEPGNDISLQQNQQNGMLSGQPQITSPAAVPQQSQQNQASQQFQTAGQQVNQPSIQPDPRPQNQQTSVDQPTDVSAPDNQGGGDGFVNDNGNSNNT